MSKFNKIEDCFTKNGNFIISDFDPYRTDHDANDDKANLYDFLFDEDGYAKYEVRNNVYKLINQNNWSIWCDAVKYYYAAECIDPNCKGNYTAIYAWRH